MTMRAIMRSNQTVKNVFGKKCFQHVAKSIVGRDADRPSYLSMSGVLAAAACWANALRAAMWHWPTATCVVTTHVTGGALYAVALQRPGQHAPCCLAAR